MLLGAAAVHRSWLRGRFFYFILFIYLNATMSNTYNAVYINPEVDDRKKTNKQKTKKAAPISYNSLCNNYSLRLFLPCTAAAAVEAPDGCSEVVVARLPD